MDEYVSRELLKNRFAKRLVWLKKDIHDEYSLGLHDGCEYDTKLIDEIPAADVVPVVHGRWERVIPSKSAAKWSTKVSCSNCHNAGYTRYKYCPNCGCLMLGGED